MTKKNIVLLLISSILVIIATSWFISKDEQTQEIHRKAQDFKLNGVISYNSGNFHNAIESFKKALQANPDDISIVIQISKSYRNLGQPGQAKSVVEEKLKLKTYENDSALIKELGYIYIDLGKPDIARKYFERLVREELDVVGGYDSLAVLAKKQGEYVEALKFFNRASPKIEELIKTKTEKESIAEHYYEYGLFLMETGHFSESFTIFQELMQFEESLFEVYFYMGKISEYLGERNRAMEMYKVFLTIAGGRLFEKERKIAEERLAALQRERSLLPAPDMIPIS